MREFEKAMVIGLACALSLAGCLDGVGKKPIAAIAVGPGGDAWENEPEHDLQPEDAIPVGADEDVGQAPETESAAEPDVPAVPAAPSCVGANPGKVVFGGKLTGEMAVIPLELFSCGEGTLEIYGIGMAEDSSPDFGLDLSSLSHEPAPDAPLLLAPGQSVLTAVTYVPDAENPVGEDGALLLDESSVLVANNSAEPELDVPVTGAGVNPCCPTAVIKVAEGDEVIPQTTLHLYGDESYAPNDGIVKWQWEVEQPPGSQSVFIPSAEFPNPTFETNVSGIYTFHLTVYDQTNTPSCFPATREVAVVCSEPLHIELLWHTPEDPDETDTGPEAGADLDLHFTHPYAAGPDLDGDGKPDGWFDLPYDCFWCNAHPNWGSYDPNTNDDPGLDRDDTDGAGPENVNLNFPEEATYKVGVHYWSDHGYGASYATVRVYIYSQLVFEISDIMLYKLDMWEVCTIDWPSAKVMLVTTPGPMYKVTPSYVNPYFQGP